MDEDDGAVDRERVIAQWLPALRRVARSYVGSRWQDDLTQDIALAVWRGLDRFRGDSTLRTYVYRIAHNRAVDFVRQLAHKPDAEVLDDVVDERPEPERVVDAKRKKERLVRAVRGLSMSLKQPLIMALEGMAYREIASVLDISESNVGVRIHRARKKLEDQLEGQS